MIVVAAIAVALFLVVEFRDGLPPRYIVRNIPGRIKRLRPGMTRAQTYEILGLKKSWIWGGLDAIPRPGGWMANTMYENYYAGAPTIIGKVYQSNPALVIQSVRPIQLRFQHGPDWSPLFGNPDDFRLIGAAFSVDGGKVEMPGSQ
jgi:hypothetical protein